MGATINMPRCRTSAVILSIFFLACFFVPAGNAVSQAKDIKIVASFYPVYIMAKNVAKDVPGVSVHNLTPVLTGCLHDYAVTTDDMKKLADARIFAANGAGAESFLDKIIAQHPNLKIIKLSEGIPLLKREGGEEDNPHLWVSIFNAIIQVNNLGKAMEEFDPGHKGLYARNTADYAARLEALDQKMHSELAPYKGKSIVTFHEAFSYFAKEFGLKIAAVVEKEPGSEPSAKELAGTVEIIKRNNITVLFSEPQYPASAARTIAQETGAKICVLDPAVTGPDEYGAYIRIMEDNLEVLKQVFEGQK
jgi:zinc transport system substrate-binding protein